MLIIKRLLALVMILSLFANAIQAISIEAQQAQALERTLVSLHNKAFGKDNLIKDFDKNSEDVKPYANLINEMAFDRKNWTLVSSDTLYAIAFQEYKFLEEALTKLSAIQKKEITPESTAEITEQIGSLNNLKTTLAIEIKNLADAKKQKGISAQAIKLIDTLNLIALQLEATANKVVKEAKALLKNGKNYLKKIEKALSLAPMASYDVAVAA